MFKRKRKQDTKPLEIQLLYLFCLIILGNQI